MNRSTFLETCGQFRKYLKFFLFALVPLSLNCTHNATPFQKQADPAFAIALSVWSERVNMQELVESGFCNLLTEHKAVRASLNTLMHCTTMYFTALKSNANNVHHLIDYCALHCTVLLKHCAALQCSQTAIYHSPALCTSDQLNCNTQHCTSINCA